MKFTKAIPQYRCHQVVSALQIEHIFPNPRGYELHFVDKSFAPHQVSLNWMMLYSVAPGGYLVIPEGGGLPGYLKREAMELYYRPVGEDTSSAREPELRPESGFLHVYGQDSWHDEAAIVGDRAALLLLRDRIERALSAGDGLAYDEGDELFQRDGEGYQLHVALTDFDEMRELQPAYFGEHHPETKRGLSPFALIEQRRKARATPH